MTDYFYYQKSTFGDWQPHISYGEPPVKRTGYDGNDPANIDRTTPKPISTMIQAAGLVIDHAVLLDACCKAWPAPK